jgi:hypothetical protein
MKLPWFPRIIIIALSFYFIDIYVRLRYRLGDEIKAATRKLASKLGSIFLICNGVLRKPFSYKLPPYTLAGKPFPILLIVTNFTNAI